MLVRPAKVEDLDNMVELLGILFSIEADFAPDPLRQRRALRLILDSPDVGVLLVATSDTRVVGMVSLLFTISTAEGGPVAWLEDMVVSPDRRDKGIGSHLLDAAVSLCRERGLKRITLLTDAANERARRFYGRNGFAASAMVPYRRHW
ncbi:MAG: GNAT family N-acetyltransferase [Anaeromyxobacter sp.]